MTEQFERPDGLGPVNGYSHVAAGVGRLVAVSGQLPVNGDGVVVDDDDALAQARQVFANLSIALRAAGARPSRHPAPDLLPDRPRGLRRRAHRPGGVPRRRSAAGCSLVQVSRLILPTARLEIDALAVTDV